MSSLQQIELYALGISDIVVLKRVNKRRTGDSKVHNCVVTHGVFSDSTGQPTSASSTELHTDCSSVASLNFVSPQTKWLKQKTQWMEDITAQTPTSS